MEKIVTETTEKKESRKANTKVKTKKVNTKEKANLITPTHLQVRNHLYHLTEPKMSNHHTELALPQKNVKLEPFNPRSTKSLPKPETPNSCSTRRTS